MENQKPISKPEDSPQQEAGEGCSGATCSPSSLTPERDAIWEKHDGLSPSLAADMLLFAGQMEIQRNDLRCEVVTLTVALKDIIAGNHGAMVRARWILSENVEAWHPLPGAPLRFRLRFVAILRLRLGAGSGLPSAGLFAVVFDPWCCLCLGSLTSGLQEVL
jgi:hypothetical protein